MANTYYNGVIRKIITAFGNTFSNITLFRYDANQVEQERILVSIAYAQKEKYVQRLQGDPVLGKKIEIAIPKLSFEMTGFSYDPSRKQNTIIKNFANSPTGTLSQYMPVPYDFDFSLYLYVRNIEDGHQVLEHILSFFTPDYTLKINLIPEMGITKEVPLILKSTSQEIDYEGSSDSETRVIIYTLTFTVKGFIYGPVSSTGLITKSITNIYNDITQDQNITFFMSNGNGNYQIGETVYSGYSKEVAIATGTVTNWVNNNLTLTNINGNFISSQPIVGLNTNASYYFTGYNTTPLEYANITITPNPITANANSNYTYTTTITEY